MELIEHDYRCGSLTTRSKAKYIIWHHSASPPDTTPEQINMWHKARGWSCIGYHFVITADGAIHQGRPYWAKGAHCTGHNNETGVCLTGNFEQKPPTEAQYEAAMELRAYLSRYDLTDKLHKELGQTSCPGKYFELSKIQREPGGGDDLSDTWNAHTVVVTQDDDAHKAALTAIAKTQNDAYKVGLLTFQADTQLGAELDSYKEYAQLNNLECVSESHRDPLAYEQMAVRALGKPVTSDCAELEKLVSDFCAEVENIS